MAYNTQKLLAYRHFLPISVGFPYKAYSKDHGAVRRFFAPDIQRRPYGQIMLGTIGIAIPEFENYWKKNNIRKPNFNYPLFSAYITNFGDLQSPAILHPGEEERDLEWVVKIENLIDRLPHTIDQIWKLLKESNPKNLYFEKIPMGSENRKISDFMDWLRDTKQSV